MHESLSNISETVFADIVGRENAIAGTDYGLGGRVHPQIAWAKLRALRDGRVDREQEVVELNSKRPCGMNEMKKPLFRLINERLSSQATVFYAIFRHEILKFCWSDPAIND